MHVRWEADAPATAHGQLVYFAEFLATTAVFEHWVASCPLQYHSGNAPDKRDVLGTLMLGLLAGHRRYAHITALRGDVLAAQALGMNKIVSEDALRRALARIEETASTVWMRSALMRSVRQALDKPWVLDIDATVKPLYGRQEGAELLIFSKNVTTDSLLVRYIFKVVIGEYWDGTKEVERGGEEAVASWADAAKGQGLR
jgi:hypothetical protein